MRVIAFATSTLLLASFAQSRQLRGDDMMLSSSNSWIHIPSSGLALIGCYKEPNSKHALYLPDADKYTSIEAVHAAASERCISSSLFTIVEDFQRNQFRVICLRSPPLPEERLSFGACEEDHKYGVSLVFRVGGMKSKSCLDAASAVQTRLVNDGENSAPNGYDHILGSFTAQSPFELFSDGCGTNVYSVSTNAMTTSSILTTESSSVKEYSKKKSDEISDSIKIGAELGGWGVTAKVSAKHEKTLTSVFDSKESQSMESSVTESWGVSRTALVGIDNFDNREHFLIFSKNFYSTLRRYKESEYSDKVGRTLLRDFGFLFAERVMYGGYFRSIATIDVSELKESYSSDKQVKECYELASSIGAKSSGFSASISFDTTSCTKEQIAEMNALANSFRKESSTATSYGMEGSGDDWFITSESAILISDPKLYEAAKTNEKLQLRPITELLDPNKISPIMFLDEEMDEHAFAEIKIMLESLVGRIHLELGTIFSDKDRLWDCYDGTRYLSKYDLVKNIFVRSCYKGM